MLKYFRCDAADLQCSGIRTYHRKFRKDLKNFRGNKVFRRQVQEQALKVVPDLCETIDYAEVQGVLFPRVAVSIFGRLGYLQRIFNPAFRTLEILARFHKDKDPERESGNPFYLLGHGQNPRSGDPDTEACPVAFQDPDQRAGSDGMLSVARSCADVYS